MNTVTDDKNRLGWIDSTKGWLIILVVLGHSIQQILGKGCYEDHIWNLIYSFHMPAFMAISGWLAYKGGSKNILWCNTILRRVCQLLLPFIVWGTISFLISKNDFEFGIFTMFIDPSQSVWFLWALFWISILFISCLKLSQLLKVDELIIISLLCILLSILMVFLKLRIFGFQFIALHFINYSLGYCIHRFKFFKIRNSFILIVLFVCWILLAWFWKMTESPFYPLLSNNLEYIVKYFYHFITASIAIVLITNVFQMIYTQKQYADMGGGANY